MTRPLGAALVRLAADDASWVHRVPAVPAPHLLTATVHGRDLADVPSSDLAARGVRILAVHDADGQGHVDLVVPVALAQGQPQWFHDLLTTVDRAWDLRLGPVQALFGDTLAVHLGH